MRTAWTIQQVNQNTLYHIGKILEGSKILYVYEGEGARYSLIIITDRYLILGSSPNKAINAYKLLDLYMFRKEDFVSFHIQYRALCFTFKHNKELELLLGDESEPYTIQKELMEVLAF